jgi:hypothetical protein
MKTKRQRQKIKDEKRQKINIKKAPEKKDRDRMKEIEMGKNGKQ